MSIRVSRIKIYFICSANSEPINLIAVELEFFFYFKDCSLDVIRIVLLAGKVGSKCF